MTPTQRRTLQQLYFAYVNDDGWLPCRTGNRHYANPIAVSNLQARGLAQYLPAHDSKDHVYARITLKGIAALRIGIKEAA